MKKTINYINKEENSIPIYDKLFYVLETYKKIENKEFLPYQMKMKKLKKKKKSIINLKKVKIPWIM